jgi:hypothetical protein
MDTKELVVDAFRQLGINARLLVGAPQGADLALELEGLDVELLVERKSLVTDDMAARLVGQAAGRVLLVVADRVTEPARKLLTSHGSGYLDLRGRLAVRTGRILIDAEVEPIKERAERVDGLSGKAGMEVAVALLLEPEKGASVRELARELRRSASTVSEVLKALRGQRYLDQENAVVGTDLFWQVADRWSRPRTHLAASPMPSDPALLAPLRLGLHESGPGWAMTDSNAAAAYGAPVVVRSDQAADFFVPDQSVVRRAVALLGAATPGQARCALRVAPVPAACEQRVDLASNPTEWPLTRPLFVALDLAQDQGRGREILDAWTPTEGTRVW